TRPAKLFGMYPQKGSVAIGSDADLVLFNPKARYHITAKKQHQNVDYTPYEGFKGRGVPQVVFSKGRIIVQNGKFTGEPGAGQFLKRKPFRLTAL
ncbi:MAG: amidohydrolase family protein, partial [Desulfobacterales bacterium]